MVLENVETDTDGVKEAIQEHVDGEGRVPLFYAISGSHLYGFPAVEDTDVDIRGYHVQENKDWRGLDRPDEQVRYHEGEIDLVSHELRKFGSLLATGNFNIIELIFNAPIVYKSALSQVNTIRMEARNHLPMDMPRHYRGMAKGNYKKYIENPERDSYTPVPKKFLYVLRGLLAARYVYENNDVVANIHSLANEHPDGKQLVGRAVELREMFGDERVPPRYERMATTAIDEMIKNDTHLEEVEYDRKAWREGIESWMEDVRSW